MTSSHFLHAFSYTETKSNSYLLTKNIYINYHYSNHALPSHGYIYINYLITFLACVFIKIPISIDRSFVETYALKTSFILFTHFFRS